MSMALFSQRGAKIYDEGINHNENRSELNEAFEYSRARKEITY